VPISEADVRWLERYAQELTRLLKDEGRSDESVLQGWLERHPAFVPMFDGPDRSGWPPWPYALISQPRLPGIVGKIPDFCWIAANSAYLTAVLVEIEIPSKRWQHDRDPGQAAPLTHAREQLASWRAWFRDPANSVTFLNEYLVPSEYQDRQFRQHYVLVHGSRSEYINDRARIRQRAASAAATDETMMSFDRLPEIADPRAAKYGCVKREGSGFTAVSVPPTWRPAEISSEALARTVGYREAIEESQVDASTKADWLSILDRQSIDRPSYKYRPRR
jgi:hypothetical protein